LQRGNGHDAKPARLEASNDFAPGVKLFQFGSVCTTRGKRRCWAIAMIDQKTVTGVCDSLAQVSGPGGVGESAARSTLPRSAADDERIALHEIGGHALVGRLLGSELGGVTCDPGPDFGGLTWGPAHDRRAKFSSQGATAITAIIGPMMPGPGESRAAVADIFLHVQTRVTELVAGSVAEALFLPGEPYPADSDRTQERALASLICSAPDSIEAYIAFCMAEAAALLRPREHIVRALTAELLIRRTMTGDEVDAVIAVAVAAKTAADERKRRLDWKRVEQSAASFAQ
jgi:hypothetical protein